MVSGTVVGSFQYINTVKEGHELTPARRLGIEFRLLIGHPETTHDPATLNDTRAIMGVSSVTIALLFFHFIPVTVPATRLTFHGDSAVQYSTKIFLSLK